jgi:hypothetical protein
MPTSAEPWDPILATLTKLHADWPSQGWSWDARFKVVTSSFGTDTAPAMRALVAGAIPHEWTSESFASAPDEVRALAQRCGDLRAGQLLMTSDAVAGMILFAMWWPWGDGQQVSVRVGVANCDRTKELYPLIRTAFGIVV